MTLAIVLLGVGLLLILAEVLFPSMGILSILAALAVIGSIAVAFAESVDLGVDFLIATSLLVPAMVLFAFQVLPRTPLGKTLIASGFSFDEGSAVDRRDLGLVGQEGVVEAPLRPAGTARLAGRRVDVVSRGELIESGARVQVLEVKGNRVVVQRLELDAPPPPPSAESPSAEAPGSGTTPGDR